MSGNIQRLMDMPACFSGNDFMRLSGLSPQSASVALSKLKAKGLIDTAGIRSGIYFNLVADRNARENCKIEALLRIYPSAVLIAESVLHAAGWITQIPSLIHVAVLERLSYQSLDGFLIEGKSKDWYRNIHPELLDEKTATFPTYGLKALPPAIALMDMVRAGVVMEPDDLDIPEESQSEVVDVFKNNQVRLPNGYILTEQTSGSQRRMRR